jgi:hypothetical protein
VVSLFAVALAGTGLLTTVGVIVAMDTFGPVSDNAQGIAEMSGDVHGEGSAILTELDAVGNTTKAITKGIAIATGGARRHGPVRLLHRLRSAPHWPTPARACATSGSTRCVQPEHAWSA